MIELSTRTEALVRLVDDLLPDGAPVKVVVIKQRYQVVAGVAEPVPGAALRLVDEPWEPGTAGSPKLPSDLALCKLGTDVIVSGEAMARDGAAVTELDVFVSVGPVSRSLRVTGTRVWYDAFGGMALTPPEPFTALPLRWELAWGGTDHDEAEQACAERHCCHRCASVLPHFRYSVPCVCENDASESRRADRFGLANEPILTWSEHIFVNDDQRRKPYVATPPPPR